MRRSLKIAFFLLVLFWVAAVALLVYFREGIAVLNPAGMIGEKQRDLLYVATWLMLIVVLPALFMTFIIAWKYRATNKKAKHAPNWDYNTLAELTWWGIPFLIIVILGAITWKSCHELDPFRPLALEKKPIKIQAVALQWKWLFIYPEQQIASVNFIQFPDQTPINFEITADAPMNSFWIPQLGGQVYAMPGMRAKLHLIANEPGVYGGRSSNLSGSGFSGMTFNAKASSEEEFDEWVASVKGSSEVLDVDAYRALTSPSEYNPVVTYRLGETDLFDAIVMKYMMPMGKDGL